MKAVVMAGGEGIRLRPLTSNQPKPMVPIVGKPCMEHILELLRRHDFEEIVVTLAYMPQAIRSYFGDGESLGLSIEYSVEEQPLGTAGSVRLARAKLDDTFLVISGDAVCDVDLGALVAEHREKGASVTIGLKSVDNPLEFGIVVTDDDGRVERFLEKPSWGQVFSDTINTGIYVIEPELLQHIPSDRPHDFATELFPHLLELGHPIYGAVLDGYWQDVGSLEQFRQANFDALDERVKLTIPGIRIRGNVWIGEGVDAGALDQVEGPAFIGNNVRLAPDSSVGAYGVLGAGVTLREGARVSRSTIDASTYIGRGALVEGAIVGRRCDIREHVRIHEGASIGDEVTVGDEASIMPGVRIYPFKEVETGAQISESVIWESRRTNRLFGPRGISGLVNVDLTPDVAVRIAAALGTALPRGSRVVASREPPDACRMIERAMIAGLTWTGVAVADLRTSPAAVTRHVVKSQGLSAGIHVEQSDVDPEAVQIRLFEFPGISLTGALEREIEKHYTRGELRRAAFDEIGETTYPTRVRDSYAQDLVDRLDVLGIRTQGFRIVVDYGYSAASFVLPLVLGPLGVEPVALHGTAPDSAARPRSSSVLDTAGLVAAVRADLGVVFDRSAERLLVIDELGHPVGDEEALMLFVRLLARRGREGTIAVPITATSRIDEIAAGSKLQVVRTPHSANELTRIAAEEGVVFAGTSSGGFVFPDVVPGYDAVGALCKLLELLAGAAQPLSALIGDLPASTRIHRSIACPWVKRGLVMRLLNERFSGYDVELLDGIKAFEERGWVQILPDPDEAFVHIYSEGATITTSEQLADETQELVEEILQGDAAPARMGERTST